MSVLGNINNSFMLDVYVWDTVYLQREAGHVSLAIKKKDAAGNLTYQRHFGFWPSREFTVCDVPFHLPAMEKKSLDDEIHYSDEEPLFTPSRYYLIAITNEQYKKIKREIHKHSEDIQSGKTRYTWLTSVNHLIYNTFNYKALFQKLNPTNLENCSTISTKILNAGEIPVKTYNLLWGVSPIDVSRQLDDLISQNQITSICFIGSSVEWSEQ